MTDEPITREMRPYQPRGGAEALMYARDPEVLISGPAGTGKTIAALTKLYLVAEKYAGMRGLIVRKTRESLTETGLVTWEDKVVPAGHPCLEGAQRKLRQAYQFPNGSEIVVGGMDKPTRVMSAEYDLVFVLESIELAENDWETLTTRLRNGKMPYQQLIADTNPDAPRHWLKVRCDAGKTRLIESRHEDNPVVWDLAAGKPTPKGADYIAKLDALTGPRKPRLRYGLWVQAEGVVYEAWDPAVHLIDRFDIPRTWQRWWVVDFGFTNPFCWQDWAEDPDGRLYLVREIYHTRRLVQDHAARIKELTVDEPRPRAIICDHDAEDRATLERHLGLPTIPAAKAVSPGIQEVGARLKKQGDGKPRLFILRDTIDQRDAGLADSKKPLCTAQEFDGYVWDTGGGRRKGEEPLKRDDHALDCVRYVCMHRAGRSGGRASDISMGGESVFENAPDVFGPGGIYGMV